MGNIAEAEKRIKNAKGQYSDNLTLSDLELTSEELEALAPKIKEIKTLTELDIRKNKLTYLPLAITELTKLTFLHLSENQLTHLPPEIGNLINLKKLHLSENRLTALPPEMSNLRQLRDLYAPGNLLTQIPQEFEALSNLNTLYLLNNPLPTEEVISLMATFGGYVVRTDMAARFKAQDHTEVIKKLYGKEGDAKLAQLNALTTVEYTDNEQNTLTGKEVVVKFMEALPTQHKLATNVYIPAAKLLLDRVFNGSEEESANTLHTLATSLGNCETPVQSLLVQVAINQNVSKAGKIPELINTLIEREAIENMITTRLKDFLAKNESIEQVQALVNTLFLPGAETKNSNKLQIEGERSRIAPITYYQDFGFRIISDELAKEFARAIAKTDANNEPVKQNGKYQLDPKKFKAITEAYFADLGVRTPREKLISSFEQQFQEALQTNELSQHYDKPEAIPLLKINDQKSTLRDLLLATPDDELQETFEAFTTQKIAAITAVTQKYKTPNLQGMASPINQSKSGNSSEPSSPKKSGRTASKRKKSL